MKSVYIRMLGEFSLEADGIRISDANNRARKVWCMLAYLICNRKTAVSQKKLIDLLYGEDSESANPENALRITMHRMRGALDQLWSGAGKELILYKSGGYWWNPEVEVTLDCEAFDTLSTPRPGEPEEQRLERYLKALELYRGEFLPKHSSEGWVIPVSAHFQNRYVELTLEAADMLIQRERYGEAAAWCRRAVEKETYHEVLHQVLMRALGAMGDAKGAGAVYDTLRKRLFDDFGIHPSEETQAVYRACAHAPGDRTLPMDEVIKQLREPVSKHGAMVCDYDYFKILCFSESRTMERSGHATHVALLSVASTTGTPMAKRSQDRILEQLGEHIRLNLRRGDTISRCSVTQYIMMLPKANYENSCMVCRRIIASFHQAHPKTAVKINYMVQPLTPGISVP